MRKILFLGGHMDGQVVRDEEHLNTWETIPPLHTWLADFVNPPYPAEPRVLYYVQKLDLFGRDVYVATETFNGGTEADNAAAWRYLTSPLAKEIMS